MSIIKSILGHLFGQLLQGMTPYKRLFFFFFDKVTKKIWHTTATKLDSDVPVGSAATILDKMVATKIALWNKILKIPVSILTF